MAWHQLSVITDEVSAPVLADYLTEIGAVSVTYMDAEDKPVYEPPLNAIKIWNSTRVIALFELAAHPAVIRALIAFEFKDMPLQNWKQEILEDQAWERSWMEHFKPMLFGNKLWICPTGMEKIEPNTVCMILDPGLAFGTGTHPTTALCLEWLATQSLQGKTVIDFGCGSGILAVAAVLLGAKTAHAIDIDPQALTATQANAEKNDVLAQIHCYLPENFSNEMADIVLANILAAPLIELNQTITALVKPAGQLVLSGILTEQAEAVSVAYHPSISLNLPVIHEDWCRLNGFKAA
ncbi:MAG: 50S ribosomal protein L11 methyltransferase [Methylococcaceae bacterium]|nr:50S ribosomal protein L11 methyltransferase [Methylococcaceae bacterium]